MEKKLLLDLQHHRVHYIKTGLVNYYITIPKNIDHTNISIELKSKMNNYNLEQNDSVWVIDNLKNTFSYIDNYNITLVLPVFDSDTVKILEKFDDTKYSIIDRLIADIINTSYKLLLDENIKLANQIILINNDRYKTFINWFNAKYKNRVICKNLLELIQLFNVNATSYKKLETPVMNFVVGSYNTEIDVPTIDDVKKEVAVTPAVSNKPIFQPSGGFASYWFLAILLILIIITIIIIFTV